MEELIAKIKLLASGYGTDEVSGLSIQLAIEKFEAVRNYPKTWDYASKLADMEKNKATIAMAAIEIEAKNGAEGQKKHSENGISREYVDGLDAFKYVVGFVNTL